jgi:hypothetical protein
MPYNTEIQNKPKMISYLEGKLLPLMLSIKPKKTESYILRALGKNSFVSQQSILIAFGDRIEKFWNMVISDSAIANNLIEDNNMINVNGRMRQIDILFNLYEFHCYYLECKCNLNFDSEKIIASNEKVIDVANSIGKDVKFGYFVPVVPEISKVELAKYNNKGINVYGVNWMIETIQAPFTSDEYFTFLREVVSPILEEMGL